MFFIALKNVDVGVDDLYLHTPVCMCVSSMNS